MSQHQELSNPTVSEVSETSPAWLDKNYIEGKLQSYYKDSSLGVLSLVLKSATSRGENYASVLTRVTVRFQRSNDSEPITRSYVVKSSFEDDGVTSNRIKQYDVYNTELNIYQKVVPKLKTLLESIGDKSKMFPEIIFVDSDRSTIIFEDLKQQNFVSPDRTKGLDIKHTKMCLDRLAKMQAASVVLDEREPGIFSEYDRGFFNRHTTDYRTFYEGVLEACGRKVLQMKGFEMYGEKILALKPKLMEYGVQVFDLIDGNVNVFVHGDYWINNVMFQYNEKDEPEDIIVLDFQYSCWGSPAIDLHYFFNTSLQEDLRLNHQDELTQHYHAVFTKTLRALDFRGKIPTLHEFHIWMVQKNFYSFTSTCLVQPLMINENAEESDFDILLSENDRAVKFKAALYESETVQRNLRTLLPIFEKKGLLDPKE